MIQTYREPASRKGQSSSSAGVAAITSISVGVPGGTKKSHKKVVLGVKGRAHDGGHEHRLLVRLAAPVKKSTM